MILHRENELDLNQAGYMFIITFSMLYMCLMLCNAILTNRYIGNNDLYILGGTLTSPFMFILDDIIAEIYGYRIAKRVIITRYLVQTMFTLICNLVVFTPHPVMLREAASYYNILGPSLFRINICGFIAYITANLINVYLLTKWKVLLKGQYFWLRSIGSSVFSEALYTFFAILMMELNHMPIEDIVKTATISFFIKVVYSIVFAWPSNLVTNYIKQKTGLDAYASPKPVWPLNFRNVVYFKK